MDSPHPLRAHHRPGATRWRLRVDSDRCIGSPVCVGSAPALFRLSKGSSVPNAEIVEPDERLLDIAAACPTEAIAVLDDDGRPVH